MASSCEWTGRRRTLRLVGRGCSRTFFCCVWIGFVVSEMMSFANAGDLPRLGERLTDEQVSAFAELALKGLDREFPNKPSHVMSGPESVKSPRELHPVFYGCFDWHSSVHGHWMLVRLLKEYPDCTVAARIRERLSAHFTAEKIAIEAAYFDAPEHRSFERMYGWAWVLRLATELHTWDDPDGRKWRQSFRPLEERIVDLAQSYLPRLAHPIRTGVHPDTGFALAQMIDYARVVGNRRLLMLAVDRCRLYYLQDRDYPVQYEPSGEDFFSSGLNEADLMRRILAKEDFAAWLERFLPGLAAGQPVNVLEPVEVTDVTDGKLVHLAGLDLSRAWALRGIASALDERSPARKVLEDAAARHAATGYKYVFSGHYEGEHWLATFAVYLQTDVSLGDGE